MISNAIRHAINLVETRGLPPEAILIAVPHLLAMDPNPSCITGAGTDRVSAVIEGLKANGT